MKQFIRVYGSGSGSVRHPGKNFEKWPEISNQIKFCRFLKTEQKFHQRNTYKLRNREKLFSISLLPIYATSLIMFLHC